MALNKTFPILGHTEAGKDRKRVVASQSGGEKYTIVDWPVLRRSAQLPAVFYFAFELNRSILK